MGFEKSGIVVQLSPGAKTGFASPKRPDRIWVPPSSQMNRNRGRLSRRWSGWGLELTTHLHLVSRLRMSSGIPSFTHTPSCRSPRLHVYFTNNSSPLVVDTNSLLQRCINPRCQAAQTINVVTWSPMWPFSQPEFWRDSQSFGKFVHPWPTGINFPRHFKATRTEYRLSVQDYL